MEANPRAARSHSEQSGTAQPGAVKSSQEEQLGTTWVTRDSNFDDVALADADTDHGATDEQYFLDDQSSHQDYANDSRHALGPGKEII